MPLEKLNGQEMRAFCDALSSAFPSRPRLVIMVRTRLDAKLDEITGAGNSLTDAIFNLVEWAEANGRLDDLLDGALAENETNEALRLLHSRLMLPSGTTASLPSALPSKAEIGPPPGIRSGRDKFRSVSLDRLTNWQRRLQICAQAICRIEKENSIATGFLVGPDIVMTFYGAIEDLIPERFKHADVSGATPLPIPQNVVLRFGQVASAALTQEPQKSSALPFSSPQRGQTYVLSDNWLVDGDPERNYALLRVKGMPGMDRGLGGEARRWLRPAAGYTFRNREPLLILSYPPGESVVVTYGTQERLRRDGWQVEYNAETPLGSAGSPCFSEDLRLIAMHLGRRSAQSPSSTGNRPDTPVEGVNSASAKSGIALPFLLHRDGFLNALLEDLPIF